MNDFIPKAPSVKTAGLGPKAQRLHALREKAAKQAGAKPLAGDDSSTSLKAKNSFAGKKTAFQRKAT
jgi:hypothetical protein